MAFHVLSSAFADGGWIPDLYSCKGADVSPSLEWDDAPVDTRSFALVAEDPDAPSGVWCHWLLYDIPSQVHALAQGYKPGSLGSSGVNDFGKLGYGGPCPPQGGAHRYFFKLHALDMHTLGLGAGIPRAELLKAIKGHVLGVAQHMGRFEQR